jgi:hypothetical protein
MADNVSIKDAADAVVPVAADEVAGVQFQRVKLDAGGGGVSAPVTAAAPLPVADAAALAALVAIASEESQALLRRLLKVADSLNTVDVNTRQRIVVDAITNGSTLSTVGTVMAVTSVNQLAGVDARYHFMDLARTAYATGIRSNLVY